MEELLWSTFLMETKQEIEANWIIQLWIETVGLFEELR